MIELFIFLILILVINNINKKLNNLIDVLKRHNIEMPPDVAENKEDEKEFEKYEEKHVEKHEICESKSQQSSTLPFENNESKEESIGIEQKFGMQLFVWLGGIALIFASFFMIKHSIEMGILSPAVRIVLGLLFGNCLLLLAFFIRSKPTFANGERISQVLTGTGVAVLYGCIFAAASVYHLISYLFSFIGMSIITACAVALSLLYGMPIAVLGLFGGFLTPAMVGTYNSHAPTLFIYLYFVFAGLMIIVYKKSWWALSLPAVFGAFIWVGVWTNMYFSSSDTTILILFLMAISITVVLASKKDYVQSIISIDDQNNKDMNFIWLLNFITFIGSCVLTAVLTAHGGFALFDWALFAILSFSGVVLAYLDEDLYWFVPVITMPVNSIMLLLWRATNWQELTLMIFIFGFLYCIGGYILQIKSKISFIWAALIAVTSVVYYLIAYHRLHSFIAVSKITLFWGGIAFLFFLISVFLLYTVYCNGRDDCSEKQFLMAIYSIMATTFASIAFFVELSDDFLPVVFAAQFCCIIFINTKFHILALRHISELLAIFFWLLLSPHINQLFLFSTSISIIQWPLLHLGLPSLFFGISSYFLQKEKTSKLIRFFEYSSMILSAGMLYFLIKNIFHGNQNFFFIAESVFESCIITNVFFSFGLLLFCGARVFKCDSAFYGGLAVYILMVFRVLLLEYFSLWNLLVSSPLFVRNVIDSSPVIMHTSWLEMIMLITKWSVVRFGLPAFFLWLGSLLIPKEKTGKLIRFFEYTAMILCFATMYLFIKAIFHWDYGSFMGSESFLESGILTNIYLIYGLFLLFRARITNKKSIFYGGCIFSSIGLYRIFVLHFISNNPLWSAQNVGHLPIFNFLFITYGLPCIFIWKARQELVYFYQGCLDGFIFFCMLLLSFTFVSFNVCQFFNGMYLYSNVASYAEIYTYSVIWILFSVALLFAGTFFKHKMMRLSSFFIMTFAIGKVFIYDAWELIGLLRVFSFFGLGVSLLCVGWFYARFVLKMHDEEKTR